MKYGRLVPREDGTTQLVDVLDLSSAPYDQRPLLGCTTDDELLQKIYSPELYAQWQAANQWFVAVPQHVQNSATFSGRDPAIASGYLNPDNTDGKGNPLLPPAP